MRNLMMLAAVVGTILLTGCAEKWDGFVYPNKHDLTNHLAIGQFATLEQCRHFALLVLNTAPLHPSAGDYECGLNCKPMGDGMNLCEKTER